MFYFSLLSTSICEMLIYQDKEKAYAYEIFLMYVFIKEANSKVTSSMPMLFLLEHKLI